MAVVIAFAAIASIAIVLIAIVVVLRLRARPRDEEVGNLRDKIPYRKLIANGVVQCEGGRLLVGWEIEGSDLASLSYGQQARKVADAAQRVMDAFGGGEVVQLDFVTFREDACGHPQRSATDRDPTSATMYEYRVEHFNEPGKQYANQSFVTMTWTPPGFLLDALGSLALADGGERWDSAVGKLQEMVDKMTDNLGDSWATRRLTLREVRIEAGALNGGDLEDATFHSDELVDVLHRCFTHEDHPIALPDSALIEGVFTDALDLEGIVADQDVEASFQPRIGDLYFDVVQIETFKKGGTKPNVLLNVVNYPMPLRVHVRAIAAHPDAIERKATRRFQMFRSNSDRRPGKRRSLVNERKAESAQNVDTEAHLWWYWNVKAVIASQNPANGRRAARAIRKMMTKAGFGARIERLGNPAALAATWPGNNTSDRSESAIDSVTLIDLSPLSTVYRGPAKHPNPDPQAEHNPPTLRFLGIGKTPVDFYDTVQDVAHLGCVGEIGGGKSTDSNGLIYADRTTSSSCEHLIFEQGYSAEAMVQAFGGTLIDADPQNPATGTCPFPRIEEPEELAIWTEWILNNLRLQRLPISNAREENVGKAMRELAKSKSRSMSLLQRKLATYDGDAADGLTPWTIRGVAGFLFDVESTAMKDVESDLQCYELSRLMKYNDPRLTGPLALLAFNRLLRKQMRSSTRVRVHLDEPSDIFADPVFAPILASYYDKIARKNYGGCRIFTQHAEQFLKHAISTSILSGTKTWIFKAMAGADGPMRAMLMEKFQMPREVCKQIASVRPKRQSVVWQDGHASLVNPTWLPEELAWIGATDKNVRLRIAELRRLYPKTYQAKWYIERGLPDAAARWTRKALSMGWITDEDVVSAA